MSSFISNSLLTGAFGDIALQNITKDDRFGLDTYFSIHGSLESVFIATGMMGIFSLLYQSFFPGQVDNLIVFIYGGLLDLFFRHTRIMPTLNSYYNNVSPPVTFIWGGIPFLIANYFK